MAKQKNKRQNNPVNTISTPVTEHHASGIKTVLNKLILLLAIVSFITYANTINHDYAYDDFSVITENTIVTKGINAIPEIFTTPYRWGFFRTSNDMYRPLSLAMFAIEYNAFDGKPEISHFLNTLVFVCCVIALFVFLDTLFDGKKRSVAFIAALLFALHPVHTEVVANIKSRDELLCFLFAMFSLITFIRYSKSGKWQQLITGSLFLFLSLLSKETSIVLLAIIPIVFYLYKQENKKRSAIICICSILIAATFLGIRYYVLSTHNAHHTTDILFIDNFLIKPLSFSTGIATSILILGRYLLLLFIPYPLVSDYSYSSIPFVNFANLWVLLSSLAYISLTGYCIVRIIRFKKDVLALGIAFYLITIALFSNVLFLTGAAMAERFLFFASTGFCLSIAVLAERLAGEDSVSMLTNKKTLRIIVPICIIFFVLTVNRNNDWKNNLTLFEADITKAPGNARLNFYLGNQLFKEINAGNIVPVEVPVKIKQARNYLTRAIAVYPEYTEAIKAMGKGYYIVGSYDSAEYYYKKALALKGDDIEAWSDLDVVYFRSNRFQQSINTCKQILSIDTNMTHKYKNIGTCFMQMAEYDSAIYYWKTGMQYSSQPSVFYSDISIAFRMAGKADSADKYEQLK